MEICPASEYVEDLLKDYLTPEAKPQIQITAPAGEDETFGLLWQVGVVLLQNFQGMYIHGAAVLYKGQVYLFTAPSGTGKSTHIRLWKQLLGDQVVILNGDKPFIRWMEGKAMVCGSPWRGKERWGVNQNGPLGGIFILRRGEQDRVASLSDLEILNELLAATIYPEDAESTEKLLDLLGKVMESVPVRALYCTPNLSAAELAVRYIEGDSLEAEKRLCTETDQ